MVPQRLVVAFRIVERIGQPLVGMMAADECVLKRRNGQTRPIGRNDESFVDPRIAGRMAVQRPRASATIAGPAINAEHDKREDRIGRPEEQAGCPAQAA